MEAKDTVISQPKLVHLLANLPDEWWQNIPDDMSPERLVQAEISFKAGRDSFLDDAGNATIPLSEVYKKGMRKVVEWVEEHCWHPSGADNKRVQECDWQAKLKEWGINEKT